MRRARAGLKDPKRPIGSFIFLGPTGVGKTELARALAEFLFDDEGALVRLDMSEYMEKFSASRLVGSPPGYVGFDEGGQLTEAVRRRPYAVVLFDEIEKAHPDVFNMLLQILDDGRLTDGKGRTVDFKNTVVIMTSNVGSSMIRQQTLGFSPDNGHEASHEDFEKRLLDELRKTFKPEFLNRVDEIIVFDPLNKEQLEQIVDLLLDRTRRLVEGQGMHLEVTEAAKARIVDEGYDAQFGARPLRRAIQRLVENPLSSELLRGSFHEGDTIRVDAGPDGELVFAHGLKRRAASRTPGGRPRVRGRGPRALPGARALAYSGCMARMRTLFVGSILGGVAERRARAPARRPALPAAARRPRRARARGLRRRALYSRILRHGRQRDCRGMTKGRPPAQSRCAVPVRCRMRSAPWSSLCSMRRRAWTTSR